MGKTAVTETAKTEASGRRRKTEYPPAGERDNSAGRKYREEGSDTEDRAAKSAKWSREETREPA